MLGRLREVVRLVFLMAATQTLLESSNGFGEEVNRFCGCRQSTATGEADEIGKPIPDARLFKRINKVADGATQGIHGPLEVLAHVHHTKAQRLDNGASNVAHILSDSASEGSDRPQQIRDLWCRIGDMPNTVADPLEEIRQALLERGPLERFEELLERVTDHVADYRLELLEHVGAVPDEFTDSTERTLEAVSQVG